MSQARKLQVYLALFENVEPVPEALDVLREAGISDQHIQVQSGVPLASSILGRPWFPTLVPKYALVGAALGFGAALFVTHGTSALYNLRVGGMPLFSIPPSLVFFFELSMLGLMVASFIGLLVESWLPPVRVRRVYHPMVSDSAVALFFESVQPLPDTVREALLTLGAREVVEVEGSLL